MKVLAIIPARGGSKRIPNKNVRDFCGKPLLAYAIEQAKTSKCINRVVIDTDSAEIAKVAEHYGVPVPFLRPSHLATDTASVNDALLFLLSRLKKDEGYEPDYLVLLQTTSPLRELEDIQACWELMRDTDADTTLTVTPTHPRLYHLDEENNLILANKLVSSSTNVQEWPQAYLLNGCFVYIFNVARFLEQKTVIMKNTKAVVCDKWRSVDLDTEEDWVLGEFLYAHKKEIEAKLKKS